ncbi:putative arabinose efflux permease, MFS family [Mariprofundus ferrinatatus]|uniref:Putative arabinose efflux permease, MFS family n=1 Tax=Mariprofundus ferrinatatus TaxID=1921087 RepID=A0A2K8L3A8_9PROT|nr:MFS transporter [Mariprofundus ferrinatatus]ATX81582.1 putative arabinose efflux permease, MFS family [Mariprofundus ferrinatatus]
MNQLERRSVFSLAGIYGLRMLGLFMILPVFSLYAEGLEGVTPMLVGVALGVYGLTMAIFQIPFGMLSDRFGRKPIITIGLLLFALGSLIAAMSDTIWGVIIGRAIQGSGAIAAAMMALMADLTEEQERTKAMAIMGVAIGMSFTLALMVGPILNASMGVDGIFWLTAVLAAAGIAILFLLVPDPKHLNFHREVETVPAQLKQVFFDAQLFRLDVGILVQHGIMMAMFTALPFVLRDKLGLPADEHAWFYLPVLMLSVLGMAPLVMLAEKKQKMKQVFIGSVLLMALSEILLGTDQRSLVAVGIGLFFFFVAFNVLEASLPSLISRLAPVESKGTAMGVYSTSQFLGAFIGGAGGGWLSGAFGIQAVFFACAIVALGWLLLALGMKVPAYLSSFMLHVEVSDQRAAEQLAAKLMQLPGVHEASVIVEDGVAYLKVDKKKFDSKLATSLTEALS